MTRPRILVVEDEPAIADAIIYALQTDGFEAVWCASCVAALQALALAPHAGSVAAADSTPPLSAHARITAGTRLAQKSTPVPLTSVPTSAPTSAPMSANAVNSASAGSAASTPIALAVLDIGLPDGSGFDLYKRIAAHDANLPVIFLTARGGEIDRVVGLEMGADDYIAKPFSPRELVARVRTVLRRGERALAAAVRSNGAAGASATGGPFAVDDERKQIRYRGQTLDLSRTEYRLLKVLIERPGRVFSRDELMARAWDDPAAAFDRTVDAHVKALRAKLRVIDAESDPIQTHRGLGYSLREESSRA